MTCPWSRPGRGPGDVTVTARTGTAVVVVVADWVTGVEASTVSDRVADVVWAPGVAENATVASTAPSDVPAAIGVMAVEVQVSTVLPVPNAQVQPVGAGAEVKVAPAGAVTFTWGSLWAGPPATVVDDVMVTVPCDPETACAGADTATDRTGTPATVVVVVVADWVTGVAPSAVSARVAEVVWTPGVAEKVTVGAMAPNDAPAAIGVVLVDVHVSTVLAVPSTQVQPVGVGAEVNVAPDGAVTVTCGAA